jgi:hypothetical protein
VFAVFYAVFYALVTLVTGTLPGLVRPWTSVLMIALLVAVILAGVFACPKARLGGGGDLACLAFLVCSFLTAGYAVCPVRSMHLAAQFAAAAVLFYLVLDADRDKLAPAMAAVATLAALFGLGMWLVGYTPRVAAPFGLHHYAAGFLLLHLPVTWRLCKRHPLWIAAVIAQAAAILGTRSMAAVVALALAALWTLRRRPLLLVAAFVALVAVAVYVPRTRQLLTRGEDPSLSTENRLRYLRTGAAMIAARPLGWGLGTVPLVAARFTPKIPDVMPPGEVLPHLHNLPVHLATETGLLGLLAAAWFVWRARSLALAPYLLFAMADYQLDMPALLFAFAAVAALEATRGNDRPLTPLVRVVMLVVAALAPFTSTCGWEDFDADRLPDLIPLSSADGAQHLDVRRLEHATQLDPYFTLAWYHLGRARAAKGDHSGAVAAFAESMLVQPVTVFAEDWDAGIYAEAQQRALKELAAIPIAADARTAHRYEELRAFLAANPTPPQGTFRRPYSEITDQGLERSTSLLVFHREEEPKYTSTISVVLPTADFYIPPGIGYLRLKANP